MEEKERVAAERDRLAAERDRVEAERHRLELESRAQSASLRSFELCFDLVAQFEVVDGVTTRTYSSPSHRKVLGHDPASCNGDVATLCHLYPLAYRQEVLPQLIASFEAGDMADGFGDADLYCWIRSERERRWARTCVPTQVSRQSRRRTIAPALSPLHTRATPAPHPLPRCSHTRAVRTLVRIRFTRSGL